ncbi:hypothetical protein [Methylobacter sp. YRD-M1]|uniref:hypothetical protein n=1 Tax=Methylobacter sp. YRD-M1 TaxID=2911520 RepID=UPI00227ABFCC|nr:hypothetical protein [Methylobacter sp. YRD-M1]WAK01881.1 hypothetical protein LZ558_19010 [Methylobacter sp. YRD-M1]
MISGFVKAINKRHERAISGGYNNYAEMVWKDCIHRDVNSVFSFLNSALQASHEETVSDNREFELIDVLDTLFETIHKTFGIIIKENENDYSVLNGDGESLGTFSLCLYNNYDDGNWFNMDGPNNGIVNTNFVEDDTLSSTQVILLWHEVGHAIHHLLADLSTVPPDLWELGSILFEELCSEVFDIPISTNCIKKDLAIALVDLELSLSNGIDEKQFINIVEHVQNSIGVNLDIDDIGKCIYGQYGGVCFTYPYCRDLVEQDRQKAIGMMQPTNK